MYCCKNVGYAGVENSVYNYRIGSILDDADSLFSQEDIFTAIVTQLTKVINIFCFGIRINSCLMGLIMDFIRHMVEVKICII